MTTWMTIYQNGQSPEFLTRTQADSLLKQTYVSDTYTATLNDDDGDMVECECAEIYDADETPDDYPNGDPQAPALWIIPDGYDVRVRNNSVKLSKSGQEE